MSIRNAKTGLRGHGPRTWCTALAVAAAMLVVAACSADVRSGDAEVYGVAKFKLPAWPETGANTVEVFNEMHYQPSYKSQEGPRVLPPLDSVPVTGREIQYGSLEEYRGLAVPEPIAVSYDPDEAQRLFSINCVVCHGATLRGYEEAVESGKASIIPFMTSGPFPANLLGEPAVAATDGELFAFVSNGGRQGYAAIERGSRSTSPMPEFRLLLSEEERWVMVMYLRAAQREPK